MPRPKHKRRKDPAAVSLGSRGGKARARALTPARRSAIAKLGADIRWAKKETRGK